MNCNLVFDSHFQQNDVSFIFRISFLKKQNMREYVGMVVLDLQKAFDTVKQKILINKLKALGLTQIALYCYLKSYLTDR